MYPNDGFRELERQECLRLLAKAPVGRIVHTRHALPAVLPVNFCVDADGAVVLRTSAASSWSARSTAWWSPSRSTRSMRSPTPAGA